MNTDGFIIVTTEAFPEQLFERQKGYFLYLTDTEHLPRQLRDEMDPEKAVIVPNTHIEMQHSGPDGLFG